MKLKELSEMRQQNPQDKEVDAHLDALAEKYELRLRPVVIDQWFERGAWYVYGASTAHGWAKEDSGDEEILPIEIRWRAFKKALISYAHELASAGRIVSFVDPQMRYGSVRVKLGDPKHSHLNNAEDVIRNQSVSGANREVLCFAMYVSDPPSKQGTDDELPPSSRGAS